MLVLKGGVGIVIGGENGSWNGVRLPVFLPSMCLQKLFAARLQAALQSHYKRLFVRVQAACGACTSTLSCQYKPLVLMLNACMHLLARRQ